MPERFDSNKGKPKTKLNEEQLIKRREKMAKRKELYGPRIRVTDGVSSKFIEKSFLEDFLKNNKDFQIWSYQH